MRADLAVLLPGHPEPDGACVRRLLERVRALRGVEEAHVVGVPDAPQLCVHYDADVVSLERLRAVVEQVGVHLDARYRHDLWRVSGITHARRAEAVAERLRDLGGVLEAEASAAGMVRVERDGNVIDAPAVLSVLAEMGVAPLRPEGESAPEEAAGEAHAHGGWFGERAELVFAGVSAVLLAVGYGLSWTSAPSWIPLAMVLGAYAFGGFFMVRETFDNLRAGTVQIESLMLVAAAGAAVLGEFAEGALLLVLFSLGHALEEYAMGRARRSIEALADLTPDTATVRRGEGLDEIPVADLAVGDVVVVRPGARLPADGFVVKGESAVDQAPVTGESVPVDKRPVPVPAAAAAAPGSVGPEHQVFAGTINGTGGLEVVVTKPSSESTMARVVELVSEAETGRSPTQRLTARFERIFVPAVLGLSFLLLFAWVVIDEPFKESFYRAMAVLVAASPCALAIATPSAVLSGIARAAQGGVLVKGGGPLERLGIVRAIAFDKTGTLTEGKPRVTDVVAEAGSAGEETLLRVAGAVEVLSDHPLAAAVVTAAKARLGDEALPEAHGLEALTGRGIQAVVDGETVTIGNVVLFDEGPGAPLPDAMRDVVQRLQQSGRTTMIVRQGDRYLGVLGLMDTPRPGVSAVLARLRAMGMRRLIMLSGDGQRVADAVAGDLGLDDAVGDLLPEDKVTYVKELAEKGDVAMIGDGVNDAPALATATVGIAMGAAGSDVALETADVALMADDLDSLVFAVGLSRATKTIIRQNLVLSLGMVGILVPATVFGLGIGPAVMLHEGSTVVVVFNALRLLAYKSA